MRTDLAKEAVSRDNGPGIDIYTEKYNEQITVERTVIVTQEAAKRLNKECGTYVSVTAEYALNRDKTHHGNLSLALAEEIKKLIPQGTASVLVAGLGNRAVTPDALGPKTLDKLMVTNHFFDMVPDGVDKRLKRVSAVAPGVLASTGVESADVIKSLVRFLHPDCVIAVDSLAAADASRINDTVQISDAGIMPGAGIGNRRTGINKAGMGVPVLAIGIPVVVYADTMLESYGVKNDLDGLFVMPKNIDAVIKDCSGIIAAAINLALHNGITTEEMDDFIY